MRAPLVNWGDGLAARIGEGNGPAILWIHGYTLDATSWFPLWTLMPGWRHIGVDLPGHGASLPLSPRDTLSSLARRIGRIALRHQVRHCVALSFGTLIATQLAIEFPEELDSVVLGAPALGGGPQDGDVAVRYDELSASYRQHGFSPALRSRWMTSPPDIFKGAEKHPSLWESLWLIVGRHAWWELADGSISRLAHEPQTSDQLRRIRARMLLLVGEEELPAFKRCAELIRRSVRDTTRIYLPSAGHLCMLEQPRLSAEIISGHCRMPGRGPEGGHSCLEEARHA